MATITSSTIVRGFSSSFPVSRDDASSWPIHEGDESGVNSPVQQASEPGDALADDPDSDWNDMSFEDKRDNLVKAAAENEGKLSPEQFRIAYQKAIKDCAYDDEDGALDPTILHHLIRKFTPTHKTHGVHKDLFKELVHRSLVELLGRLGELDGLSNALHEAINRKHFQLLEFVCNKASESGDGDLKKLVVNAISTKDAKNHHQNCLHAAIRRLAPLGVISSLIKCANKESFETQRADDGNTPLHDFAEFTAMRFKVDRCKCKRCQKDFAEADSMGERAYTQRYKETMTDIIDRYEEALSTFNKAGQTPFVVHRQTRKRLDVADLNDLEYLSAEEAKLAGADVVPQHQVTPALSASDSIPIDIEETGRPSVGQQQRRVDPRKAQIRRAPPSTPAKTETPHDENAGRYSLYMAWEISRELLERCSSRPNWEDAEKSIFGDRERDGKILLSYNLNARVHSTHTSNLCR